MKRAIRLRPRMRPNWPPLLTWLALASWLAIASWLALAPARAAAAEAPPGPKPQKYSYVYDMMDHSLFRPATRFFDLALAGRKATGNLREAANVDEHDQVRLPSTWWQPRVGLRNVTVAQMMAGPGSGKGPAPGRWTVTSAKLEGVTAGFQIKDSAGDKFLVKFDPQAYPELGTSCDVIGSRLFWAAGYNVPDNAIAWFRASDLEVGEKATYSEGGRKQPMTRAYLEQLLTRVPPPLEGRYRCVASRLLEGKPLGPFEYRGTRKDDPEDLVPHELRRELRGLWTVCAWLNHADSRGPNSLDMWVTDHGRSFVRHHLIDFSAILGAGRNGPRAYQTGTEYYVDYLVMGRQGATLGLVPARWEAVVDPKIPSAGFVEAKVFDTKSWRPDYPNPAFDDRTERDVRWGARIVAGFTDEHIRAAVGAAHFSDPRAADYLTRVLIERRDRLVKRWLGREGPRVMATH